jgi:DNA-3-methyladenine glycosylase
MVADLDWLGLSSVEVAPRLLGWHLVRRLDGVAYRGIIVETEAYREGDPACHGFRRQTPRNAAIFGPPGSLYVYLIYGLYHCLNIVTEEEGRCSAVLVRAVLLDCLPPAIVAAKPQRAAAGPGKLCRVLGIDRQLNGAPLSPTTGLWLEPGAPPSAIRQTTRIGLTQGTDLPWRWYIEGHPAVSRRSREPKTPHPGNGTSQSGWPSPPRELKESNKSRIFADRNPKIGW